MHEEHETQLERAVFSGEPKPGSKRDRDIMRVMQPGFLEAFTEAAQRADDASFHDNQGANSHTAVTSWISMCKALGIAALRPLDPVSSSLYEKLCEIDVVKVWAWWKVQCGAAPPTVRNYLSILNGWHERRTGVGLAGNMSHHSVVRLLNGLSILRGAPPPKKLRAGVRPKDLRAGIDKVYISGSPADVNLATAMTAGFGAALRACEYVRGKRKCFDPERGSMSRADVVFEFDDDGELTSACLMAVNSKAKGAEKFRKLPHYLPIDGKFVSPGRLLHYLVKVADPVPAELAYITPMFRQPRNGQQIDIDELRTELRRVMRAAGRPPSAYGTHSLRIGRATATAFVGGDELDIKDSGKWSSQQYLKYVRERRAEALRLGKLACSAEVDDFENEFLGIELDPDLNAFADSSDEDGM